MAVTRINHCLLIRLGSFCTFMVLVATLGFKSCDNHGWYNGGSTLENIGRSYFHEHPKNDFHFLNVISSNKRSHHTP